MRNYFYCGLLFVLSLFTLGSCSNGGLKVINSLAKNGPFALYKDWAYSEQSTKKLDIYVPNNQEVKATVLFFYGGCWGQCRKFEKGDYLFLAETLVEQGYAVIIPDYKQFPRYKFKDILDDAKTISLWTLNNREKFGIYSDKFFIMGHSSGAHIAALLVEDESLLSDNLKQITGFIGLAGPYDFYPFHENYLYDLFSAENNYYASQPINFIDGNEPPHLIIQGMNDDRVDSANASHLANKLKSYGVPTQLKLLEKFRHGTLLLSLSKPFKKDSEVLKSINSFIQSMD